MPSGSVSASATGKTPSACCTSESWKGILPEGPDRRGDHDTKPGTSALDKSRQEPRSPTDLLEERQNGDNDQTDDGIYRDVARKAARRKCAPAALRGRVIEAVSSRREPVFPWESPLVGNRDRQHRSVHDSRKQQDRDDDVSRGKAIPLDPKILTGHGADDHQGDRRDEHREEPQSDERAPESTGQSDDEA